MRISNIKVFEDITEEELLNRVCKKNKIDKSKIVSWNIFKKSIDARDKSNVHYNYTVDIFLEGDKVEKVDLLKINNPVQFHKRPVVIGTGPAGLFAAYTLALNGANPIVIEQGKCVEDRQKDVEEFINNGKLCVTSNVQFGEGGAGTFSDGKLTTGVNNPLNKTVLETFVKFGAPEQIMYVNKPHIGTDNLIHVVRNMREEIKRLGAEVLFETKVVGFEFEENRNTKKLVAILLANGKRVETDTVILAIGHSARDTFEKLYSEGVKMEAKSFSVGVRIEHKQSMINESQYGNKTKLKLPPAEYKLVYHAEDGRTCYTFCMCPGGTVMASSSEEGTIVTNGMSKYARDGENANSAVLVNVTPKDFINGKATENPLAGMYFQKELEEKAFGLGGRNYYAPIQRVEDFLNGVKSDKIGEIKPTYRPGVTLSDLNEILPEFVSKTLKEGILYFDKKLKGFAEPDAIMTGVETRSSSPVKIIRDENLESNYKGLYPCGEGAGYAGGIMTAAMDGIKVAKGILTVHGDVP